MRKMKTMDGNAAAAYISYAFTDVAAIYPITPSSNMAENVDEWSAKGQKNLFGETVRVVEMQSEAGAAGAVHGSLQAGALTTTFTASQGLLLMIPNMYKMAGELLPAVLHVSARALATHALSIFGDHQDVMSARQTGFALLAESSVQEVMDLSAVAHLAAIKGKVPFLAFFDGFRTSHEVQKIEVIEYSELDALLDKKAVKEFRDNALNPEHPVTRGTAQNPDIYFQGREASNKYYDAIPEIVEGYMAEITKITGREYHLFNYYGANDADRVIIAMGSACDTIKETIDYLNKNGEKVGLVNVHLYRPFAIDRFLKAIPKTCKKIAVLDRTKEPGAPGEPLYLDVRNSYFDAEEKMTIVGGRYGLGSKEVTPGQIIAVYENLKAAKPKNNFTIGIKDDVTGLSLNVEKEVETTPEGTIQCKFWGLGSDGTVGANKNAIKIIGDHTDMYAQAYFSYDSKKSGGITVSHLRFGKKPIGSPYLINNADFIACHQQSYIYNYDVLAGIKENGTFLLNTIWSKDEVIANLPNGMKKVLAEKNIKFYTIDAVKIAAELGLRGRINMVMQAGFFKLANIISEADAVKYMKEAVVNSYGKKGEKIVNMNFAAIDQGLNALVKIDVPADWKSLEEVKSASKDVPAFITNILEPINRQEGDKLPVSAFMDTPDGTFPNGSAAYEKRGIAIDVPEWSLDACIQCNQCSYVCPHACIRPYLLTDEELKNAPASFNAKKATGGKNFEGLNYRITVSPLDCTGCGNCVEVCPAPTKALLMKPIDSQMVEQENFDFAVKLKNKKNPMDKGTVKGSQFEQPLLEFSGACAGCGETPYNKLITQLFGDRMTIANATGCSSIWGGSAPSTPYTKNDEGKGPAWANSLFEDNAEYGYGMLIGAEATRKKILTAANDLLAGNVDADLKAALEAWINGYDDGDKSKELSDALVSVLEKQSKSEKVDFILENKDYLIKRSTWVFGGDGWAYDIGFGGVDHVLASGEDINLLVMDTEVYSNTGGQSSKSTPTAAIAKFASSGKRTKKKDLGLMAMSYGYVYVAQIGMGADKNQTIKAIKEAEAYKGPSLIIAYAPCISHGLKSGMRCSQNETKLAVETGYWQLYRFNPELKNEGKNPFILDSKDPVKPFREFIDNEVRFTSLAKAYPEVAEELFAKTEEDAKEKLEAYKKLARD